MDNYLFRFRSPHPAKNRKRITAQIQVESHLFIENNQCRRALHRVKMIDKDDRLKQLYCHIIN